MWLWRPVKRGPMLGLGLGLIVGGMEAVALAATAPISLDPLQGILWGLVSVAIGGLVGLVSGLLGGIIAEWGVRWPALPARHAVAMGGAGFFLSGWHLWAMAAVKLGQGLPIPAAALAATPIGVAGVVYFNAHYWLRREELGEERRLGWSVGSVVLGVVLGVGGGVWLSMQHQGSSQALDVDPHVLLVTVEGLERTDLAAFSAAAPVATPHIDALAEDAIRFHEAISPVPETGPMHTALFTGRHPVRVGVWSDEHTLGRVWPTLPDRLRREGYATGAFVSTLGAGDHTGLARGFGVYDDDRGSHLLPPGTEALRLVQLVDGALMRWVPGLSSWPRLAGRPDAETVDRATAWMTRHADRPQLAWIQLAGLQGLHGAARTQALERLDAHVGALVGALGPPDARPRIVVLTGVGAGNPATDGIAEARIGVPLLFVPKKLRIFEPDVRLAVRTMDIPATILAQLGLKPFDNVDGTDLSGFAQKTKTRGYASLLASRVAGPTQPQLVLGYRAGRSGSTAMIKLVAQPSTDSVAFYDLGDDPTEQHNLSADQPDAVSELLGHTLAEAGDAREGVLPKPDVSAGIQRVLRHHRFGSGH